MTSKTFKAHPLMILFNLRQFFILAIIPILRGIINALSWDLINWTDGLWIDIMILTSILVFSIARWLRSLYSYDDYGITQKKGLFFVKETQLPWNHISVIKISRPFFTRLFGACYLRGDSIGGSYRNTDINLIITKEQGEEIAKYYLTTQNNNSEFTAIKPTRSSILGFAFISTNSFVGVFYLATFISQSGKIIGRDFSQMLVGTFESIARTISLKIPPAAAALTYLIIFTWLIGVLFTIFRYHQFQVWRKEYTLLMSSGIFSKQKYLVDTRQLNFINIRQNIVTFFLNTYSMFISAVGVGKERIDITCILPMEQEKHMETDVQRLFPKLSISQLTLTPVPWGFMRYLYQPLFSCLGIGIVYVLGIYFVPSWKAFIQFLCLMSFIPGVSFLIMRFVEYRSSGIGMNTNSITMRYSTGFTLHTQIIPLDRIVKIEINQGFFQKFGDHCDVTIFTQSETRSRHRCRNISQTKAAELFHIFLHDGEKNKISPFTLNAILKK